MPQELVIAVSSLIPVSESFLEELKEKAAEVAKRVSPLQVVILCNDGESSAHCLNTIVHEFLKMPEAAWLWLIKEDLQWTPDDAAKLLATKRPVIGCLYTPCMEWAGWQATFYEEINADEHGVVQVPEIGGNGLLVHRSVFAKIVANPAYPLEFRDENSWDFHHAFFQQARVMFKGLSRLLREEQFFQWMCREAGVGIYCHSKVRIKRKGPNGVIYPRGGQEPNLVPIPAPNAAEWPYNPIPGRIVVCLQWYEGDREQAQRLYNLISDSRCLACEWDVVLVAHDSNLKYPQGPNKLAFDLMKQAADGVAWAKGAKAILLMEPDCIPVSKDWLNQLSEEWDRAAGQGKMVLGHWQKESGGHINGNLMFDPRLANAVDLGDAPPKRPWDIAYPPIFEPVWARTGLIKNLYRQTNVFDTDMRTPAVGTKPPVLIHGVRDNSAWDYAKRMMQ